MSPFPELGRRRIRAQTTATDSFSKPSTSPLSTTPSTAQSPRHFHSGTPHATRQSPSDASLFHQAHRFPRLYRHTAQANGGITQATAGDSLQRGWQTTLQEAPSSAQYVRRKQVPSSFLQTGKVRCTLTHDHGRHQQAQQGRPASTYSTKQALHWTAPARDAVAPQILGMHCVEVDV